MDLATVGKGGNYRNTELGYQGIRNVQQIKKDTGISFSFTAAFIVCQTKKPERHCSSKLHEDYSKTLPTYKIKSLNPPAQL